MNPHSSPLIDVLPPKLVRYLVFSAGLLHPADVLSLALTCKALCNILLPKKDQGDTTSKAKNALKDITTRLTNLPSADAPFLDTWDSPGEWSMSEVGAERRAFEPPLVAGPGLVIPGGSSLGGLVALDPDGFARFVTLLETVAAANADEDGYGRSYGYVESEGTLSVVPFAMGWNPARKVTAPAVFSALGLEPSAASDDACCTADVPGEGLFVPDPGEDAEDDLRSWHFDAPSLLGVDCSDYDWEDMDSDDVAEWKELEDTAGQIARLLGPAVELSAGADVYMNPCPLLLLSSSCVNGCLVGFLSAAIWT